MEVAMELVLSQGRPENFEGRQENEIRVYELLDSLNIRYDRVDHEPAETMEACAKIDEVLKPAVICKNLFLCNTQKTNFYLLMIKEDKKFKTKEISKQINSARLSFAPSEYMEEYLDIKPGAVSVMGLMNDRENHVRLLIDEDVLQEEYFGCHPCVNTSSLRLQMSDVLGRFLEAVHHDYTAVHLDGMS
jgi:Ala-tRNA(Pro) deacylase